MNNQSVQRTVKRAVTRRLGLAAAVSVAAIVLLPVGAFAATKTTKVAPKTAKKAAPKAASKAAVFKSDLPSITVLDLSSNKNVDLASFVDGKRPSLIWFWAPH